MKRFGFVAAAMAAFAMGAVPMVASAAQQRGPAPITQAQRDQGAKEAPDAVTAAKVSCNISEAAHLAAGTNAAKQKVNFYEVACSQGLGYIIEKAPETAQAYNCIAINAQAAADVAAGKQAGLSCRLQANADAKQGLVPFITASGRTCTITDARAMGATAAGENYFEASCGGKGYVIKTAVPGSGAAAEVLDCAEFLGTQSECKLTTKEQIVASIGQLATSNNTACATPSDARYVGAGQSAVYFELACGAGNPGYMIETDKTGKFRIAYECSKASAIGGGCKLTDATVSEEAEAATYTKLAQDNGYPCQVSKYRFIGVDQNTKSEVVELACNNRPDGAVAMFPTTAGAKGRVMDCVASGAVGVACNLTQPSASFAKYTAGLAAMGKTQCKVSGAKWLAATTDGHDLIETACSDGLPGFVMSIARADGKVRELLTCGLHPADQHRFGGGCRRRPLSGDPT
jgi:hypothetical protein